MIRKYLILLTLLILAGNQLFPAGSFSATSINVNPDTSKSATSTSKATVDKKPKRHQPATKKKKEGKVRFKKLKTILFTIFLGHFGVHRIYLGTDWKVPLFYTLTLGGGLGLLPLIDLFCIIFTNDLSVYEGISRFFMWI